MAWGIVWVHACVYTCIRGSRYSWTRQFLMCFAVETKRGGCRSGDGIEGATENGVVGHFNVASRRRKVSLVFFWNCADPTLSTERRSSRWIQKLLGIGRERGFEQSGAFARVPAAWNEGFTAR